MPWAGGHPAGKRIGGQRQLQGANRPQAQAPQAQEKAQQEKASQAKAPQASQGQGEGEPMRTRKLLALIALQILLQSAGLLAIAHWLAPPAQAASPQAAWKLTLN